MTHYPHEHPFSPHYEGRIAAELCRPRYPNRAHAPSPQSKARLLPPKPKKGNHGPTR